MSAPVSVTVSRRFDSVPDRLFDSWLDPESVCRWLFATPDGETIRCEVDPRVGGGFRIDERRGDTVVEHFGEYLEIDRPRRIVFSFATSFAPDEATRVTVAIEPDGNGARLTLVHDGVWADHENRTRDGWTMILEGLAGALAGG